MPRHLPLLILPLLLLATGCGEQGPPQTVRIEVFTKQFVEKPGEAEDRNKGREVALRGKVKLPGTRRLVLDGGGNFGGSKRDDVVCDFGEELPDLLGGVKAGKTVTVIGTFESRNGTLKTLNLVDCDLGE